jgi:cytochrome c-type biogenesis protein CcsB
MPKSMTDAVQKLTVPPEHAKRFGALPVQLSNGRIVPMNTFSSQVLRKLYKNTRFGQLDSDRFLLGLLAVPEMWMHVPLIVHSSDAMAGYFSLPGKECAYLDFFREDGSYKLHVKLNEAYRKTPAERTGFDKDVIKLDEKVNILHQLFEHQLIRLFPEIDDPDQNWYAPGDDLSAFSGRDSMFVSHIFIWYLSEVQDAIPSGDWSKPNEILDMITIYQTTKNNVPEFDRKIIDLELKYNRLEVFRWCKTGYFSLGGLLLILSFVSFFRKKPWIGLMIKILGIGVLLVFLFHMLGMGMRWRISGNGPWSNSYETMIFMAWASVLAGLMFARRSTITFSLATLFAGIVLFVSGLNWMDPQINPLVPVLKSPWLMFHVAVLMAAYGFFGVSFLIGLVNLLMMALSRKNKLAAYIESIRELSIINEISLYIGLILMTVGTFMGAVWANESWGRYWGWDPKETWALITIIVYVMVTHLHLVRKWNKLWLFNLCSVIAFASVLMTYFGVNYFLSGMHSYGN